MTAKAVTLALEIPPKTDLAHQRPESTRIVATGILGRCLEVLRQPDQGVLHDGIELETGPTLQTGPNHDLVNAVMRGALATRQTDRIEVAATTTIVAVVMTLVVVDLGAGHLLVEGPPLNLLTDSRDRTRPLRNRAENLAKLNRQRRANLTRWVMTPRLFTMQYTIQEGIILDTHTHRTAHLLQSCTD